jgi:hypothetical protein
VLSQSIPSSKVTGRCRSGPPSLHGGGPMCRKVCGWAFVARSCPLRYFGHHF